jgi:hypothetical protein
VSQMTETYTTRDFVQATQGSLFVGYAPESKTHSETYTSDPSLEVASASHVPASAGVPADQH